MSEKPLIPLKDSGNDPPLDVAQLREVAWGELKPEDRDYLRRLARSGVEECVFAFGIEAVRSAGRDGGFILEKMNGSVKDAINSLGITNSNAIYALLRIAVNDVLQGESVSLV